MASVLVAGIVIFEFCIVLTRVAKSLFYLCGPTKNIEGQSIDLVDVVGQAEVA